MYIFTQKQHFTVVGALIALAFGLVGAGIAGFLLFWISHLLTFSLIIVFPAVAAAIAGLVLAGGIKTGAVRHSGVAILISIITAVALFSVEHYNAYQVQYLGEVRDALQQEDSSVVVDNAMIQQLADKFLQESTGSTGFIGFLKLEAGQHTEVGRLRNMASGTGIRLGGSEGVLMVVELVIMSIVIFALGASTSRDPYDDVVGEWYGNPEPLMAVSTGSPNEAKFLAAVERGELLEALQFGNEPNYPADRKIVALRRSSNTRTALLEVTDVSFDDKGREQSKVERRGLVKWSAINPLLEQLNSQPVAQNAAAPVAQNAAAPVAQNAAAPVAQSASQPKPSAHQTVIMLENPRSQTVQTTTNGIKLGR